MLDRNDLDAIAQIMFEHDFKGIGNQVFWYWTLNYKQRKQSPELHAVMQRTKKYLPLHLNSEHPYIVLIVKWRLEHNK